MSDVQLRFDLLIEARNNLYEHWRQKIKVEERIAEFEDRTPRPINPPTNNKIMRYAAELYEFCQTGGTQTTPPAVSTPPASE